MKIVFLTCPGYGFTNTTKLFIKHLVDMRNTVYYFSSIQYASHMEDTGCEFISYKDCFEEYQVEKSSEYDTFYSVKNALNQSISQWKAQKKVIESVQEIIRNIEPDVILHDSCMYSGKYISRVLGIKAVAVFATIPISGGYLKQGNSYYANNYFHFAPILGAKDRDNAVKKFKRYFESYLDKIHPIPDYFEVFQSTEDFNLVFSPRLIIPYEQMYDERYCFISPFLYKSEKKGRIKVDKPNIYISFGTSWTPQKKLIENFYKQLGDYEANIIFSFGGKLSESVCGIPPKNFQVSNFVDQRAVLEKTDIYIGSGGMTSVYEVIEYDIPMILIPFAQADHYIIAEQVEKNGCGVTLDFHNLEFVNLKLELDKVLCNSKYKRNVKKLHHKMIQPDGITDAIEMMLKYLKGH